VAHSNPPPNSGNLPRWRNACRFPTAIGSNLRFPGQPYDVETGKHYNYFRDYDSSLGRYIQSDPVGLLAGVDTYGYTGSNPLIRTDRDGRLAVGLGGVWIGLCAAAAYQAASDLYPSPGDDKKKHCYASCFLNQCTLLTFWPSFGIGFGFEVAQGITRIGHYDSKDVDANIYGIIISYKGRCQPQCDVCPIK
jgi:RHS repeat-associated protein